MIIAAFDFVKSQATLQALMTLIVHKIYLVVEMSLLWSYHCKLQSAISDKSQVSMIEAGFHASIDSGTEMTPQLYIKYGQGRFVRHSYRKVFIWTLIPISSNFQGAWHMMMGKVFVILIEKSCHDHVSWYMHLVKTKKNKQCMLYDVLWTWESAYKAWHLPMHFNNI